MEWNETLYRLGQGERGRTGVLLLHGFSGSPCSMQGLALHLLQEGFSVALPLLTGHGQTPEALERARWTDWTRDAAEAFKWLDDRVEKVFVCGLSMGGTLALWLAEHVTDLGGVVTINAIIRHPKERLMRIAGKLGFPRWIPAVGNDIKAQGVDEMAYERIPVRSARQLALLLSTVRKDLVSVTCPALVFSSAVDHVVPPANQREIYGTIGSPDKEFVELPDSYHVATMDNDKEWVFGAVSRFVSMRS